MNQSITYDRHILGLSVQFFSKKLALISLRNQWLNPSPLLLFTPIAAKPSKSTRGDFNC